MYNNTKYLHIFVVMKLCFCSEELWNAFESFRTEATEQRCRGRRWLQHTKKLGEALKILRYVLRAYSD